MAKLKSDAAQENIEQLRKRFEALNEKRIAAETNRKSAEEALEKLRKKARDEYQTDDLAELQKKLKDMIANNERLRADYQKHLDGIETQLASVEESHRAAHGGSIPAEGRRA